MQETSGSNSFLAILKRKARIEQSKWALPWAFLNLVLALIVYIDIDQGSIASYFGSSLLWYIECSLGAVFLINSIVDVFRYLWSHVYEAPIDVDERQKQLFRIDDSDVGFRKKSPPAAVVQTSTPVKCSPGESFVLQSSWASTSFGSDPNVSLSSSSWMFRHSSPQHQASGFSSPASGGSLRKLCRPSASFFEWNISDLQSLDRYMKECSQLEQTSQLMTSGESLLSETSGSMSVYQLSTRSPQAAPQTDDPEATYSGDGVWSKWGIQERQLNQWVENLRKWVSQTILVKLSSEIDSINNTLKRLGSSDLQIGEASQSTLRQVSLTKSQHLPTLSALLPYLDLNANQEYLVQRIKELARGGCMSDFRWSSGSRYKGKAWGDYLPTDCALVLHILCTYLDSRLPPDPRYPDGKTFTSQFFSKTPDKPGSQQSLLRYTSLLALHQDKEGWHAREGQPRPFRCQHSMGHRLEHPLHFFFSCMPRLQCGHPEDHFSSVAT
ncbi:transmembrane protein 209-like isoform X2 [Ornithodoros turicata]|uniref:transmembrane protein 209-like isoform X2 n=1 Tax=Ornithodoros turicata TaxID=34597 RepID=UPI0031386D49